MPIIFENDEEKKKKQQQSGFVFDTSPVDTSTVQDDAYFDTSSVDQTKKEDKGLLGNITGAVGGFVRSAVKLFADDDMEKALGVADTEEERAAKFAEQNLDDNRRNAVLASSIEVKKNNDRIAELNKQIAQHQENLKSIKKNATSLDNIGKGKQTSGDGITSGYGAEAQDRDKLQQEKRQLELANSIYQDVIDGNKDRGFFADLWDGIKDSFAEGEKLLPFVGGIDETVENIDIIKAQQKLAAGQELTPMEEARLSTAKAKDLEGKYLDRGIGYVVGAALTQMPAFGLEFAATGGAFTATRQTVKEAAIKGIPKAAESKVGRVVLESIGLLSGGAAQTLANPQMIASSASGYMIPNYDVISDDKGNLKIDVSVEGDSFEKAMAKGLGTSFVNVFSERAGAVIEKPTEFLQKAVLAKFAMKNNLTTPSAVQAALKHMGWNGVLGEVFEEEVAELGNAPIEERDYHAPWTPEGMERVLVNTLTISAFRGISAVPDTAIHAAEKNSSKADKLTLEDIDRELGEVSSGSRVDDAATTDRGGGGKPDEDERIDQLPKSVQDAMRQTIEDAGGTPFDTETEATNSQDSGLSVNVSRDVINTSDQRLIDLQTAVEQGNQDTIRQLSAAIAQDDPIRTQADTVIGGEATVEPMTKATSQIEATTAEGLSDRNRARSEANTAAITEQTLNGEREQFRLNTPENIENAARTPENAIPAKATADTMVTVYRASTGDITKGDHVTLQKSNAERYLGQRQGATVREVRVPLGSLVRSGGLRTEFVYAPVGAKTTKTDVGVATSAIHLPSKGVYARLTKSQLEQLKDEVGNIPFTKEDIVHLTPTERLEKSDAKEVSLDEIKAMSANAKKAIDGADKRSRDEDKGNKETKEKPTTKGKKETKGKSAKIKESITSAEDAIAYFKQNKGRGIDMDAFFKENYPDQMDMLRKAKRELKAEQIEEEAKTKAEKEYAARVNKAIADNVTVAEFNRILDSAPRPETSLSDDKPEFVPEDADEQEFMADIKKERNFIENEHIKFLKDSGGQGVTQGGLIIDRQAGSATEGNVVGRFGRVSNNPVWYQKAMREKGYKRLTLSDYRRIAQDQLLNGYKDIDGEIEPNYEYIALVDLENQLLRANQAAPKTPTGFASSKSDLRIPIEGGYIKNGIPMMYTHGYSAAELPEATRLVRINDELVAVTPNDEAYNKYHKPVEVKPEDILPEADYYIVIEGRFIPVKYAGSNNTKAPTGFASTGGYSDNPSLTAMQQEYEAIRQKAQQVGGQKLTEAEQDRYDVLKDRIAVAEGRKQKPNPARWVSNKPIKIATPLFRGEGEAGGTGLAMFGAGLYSTPSKTEAKKYGKVRELGSEAMPSNPLQFVTSDDVRAWESEMARQLEVPRRKLYAKDTGLETLVMEQGYDGVTVGTGKEMYVVKFNTDKARKVPTPTGYASSGGYTNLDMGALPISEIKPIELPELVGLVQDLTGRAPVVGSLRGNAIGRFYSKDGEIKLDYALFKTDPEVAAKTLAHEIGHLADWLPDENMSRGNLVGRIASLNKHLKQKYGDLDNKVIKQELINLTQAWKPFDTTADPNFTKYRYSSPELYADAISVLFNKPELLDTVAPNFKAGFFEYMNRKPELREELLSTWDLYLNGREAVLAKRYERVIGGYHKAEALRDTVEVQEKPKQNTLEELQQKHMTRFSPVYRRIKELEKQGIHVSEKQAIRMSLEMLDYRNNKEQVFIHDVKTKVMDKLTEAGISEDDFGFVLQMEKNINQREGMANPSGLSDKDSQELLDNMLAKYTPEAVDTLMQAKKDFHDIVFKQVERGQKVGIYSKKVFDEVMLPAKDVYVTYSVIDYIDKNYISAEVKQARGTLKNIENPYVSTMLKTTSLINEIRTQEAKANLVAFYQKYDKKSISQAKRWRKGEQVGNWIREKDKDIIELYADGKKVAFNVDPWVASIFNKVAKFEDANWFVKNVLSPFNRVFKSLVTSWRPAFFLYTNIKRDISRTTRNIRAILRLEDKQKVSLVTPLYKFLKAIPEGKKFNQGVLTDLHKEMLELGAMGVAFNTHDFSVSDETALRNILRQYKVLPTDSPTKKRNAFLKPITKVIDAMEFVGATLETSQKIAGYQILKEKMNNAEKAAFYTRNYIGTPNFKDGGLQKHIDNNVFVFSNVMVQGMRADLDLATNRKSAPSYFSDIFIMDVVPKLVMAGMAAGLFGELLKQIIDGASEYDKTNFIIIPLGLTENGKSVYFRLPHDEMGRAYASLVWKATSAINGDLKKPEQIMSVGANFLPSINPLIDLAGAWLSYAEGQNPYDSFYGRNVLSDTEYNIGGLQAFQKMVTWSLDKSGVGVFSSYDSRTDTTLEATLKKTPMLSSMIKITDYGHTEKANLVKDEERKAQAIKTDKSAKALELTVDEYMRDRSQENFNRLQNKYVSEAVEDKSDKAAITRAKNKFTEEVLYQTSDWRVRAIVTATTNAQKERILNNFRGEMTEAEYQDMLNRLLKGKAISEKFYKEMR